MTYTELVFKASHADISEDTLGASGPVRHPACSCGGALMPSEGASRCRECSRVLRSGTPTFPSWKKNCGRQMASSYAAACFPERRVSFFLYLFLLTLALSRTPFQNQRTYLFSISLSRSAASVVMILPGLLKFSRSLKVCSK